MIIEGCPKNLREPARIFFDGNIGELIDQIKGVLSGYLKDYEIIVVDVGSSDRTRDISKEKGAKVIIQESPGYGGALKEGFSIASGKYIITMDADLSHNPEFIRAMIEKKNDADLIIASRYVKGGSAEIGPCRRVLSIILNRVFSLILSLPYKDISSGFRMYDRNYLSRISITRKNFDVLEEILIKIYKNNIIVEGLN